MMKEMKSKYQQKNFIEVKVIWEQDCPHCDGYFQYMPELCERENNRLIIYCPYCGQKMKIFL